MVLLVIAGASLGLSFLAARAPGGSTPFPAPRAPVLSLRRAPAFLSQLAADARLQVALDRALGDPALSAGRDQVCLAVHDAGGRPVYLRDPARSLVPASNLKLVTGLVALAKLGPDTRFRTELRGRPAGADGVVAGDLWFVGSGDPLLATADHAAIAGYGGKARTATPLEALADRLVASGVRQVRGRLVGDESRYDAQRYVPTWKPSYVADGESGPASALTVNNGFVQLKPRPLPAPAPAAHAAEVLAALLQARGVGVAGVGEGPAPADAQPLAAVESPPISDIVGEMLRESDNLTAELLVKEIGHRVGGGGTTERGVAVVRTEVAAAGLPTAGLANLDGSGLDRADRATCSLLIGALERDGEQGRIGRSLPVAARDGTLAKRYLGTPVAGRLRAKTGSLEGVAGFTGWADGRDGRSRSFSMLVNGLPTEAAGRALEDRLGAALVQYPDAPAPADLAP